MAKKRPIANTKRSYTVLKKILKFCRINLNSFPLFFRALFTRQTLQFNWLKWALKTQAWWLKPITSLRKRSSVSIPKFTLSLPKFAISLPKLTVAKPTLAVAKPKPTIAEQKPVVEKVYVEKTTTHRVRYLNHPAALGWSITPVLRSIKVGLGANITRHKPRLPFRVPKVRVPKIGVPQTHLKIHVPAVTFPTLFALPKSLRFLKLSKLTRVKKTTRASKSKARKPKVTIVFSRPRFSWLTKVKIRVALLGLFVSLMAASSYAGYVYILKDLPSPQQLSMGEQIVTTRILDRHGNVLYRVYEDENRTLVTLNDIPRDLINATIAIEDKNFYHHHGFSVTGIVRAAIANTREQTVQQGGSTITQQLVKQRLLSSERTIQRKLREFVLSIMSEFTYSKDQILEMYFNQVPYGGSSYGVEEAAQRYFGKSVRDLNLAESSLLAGLPQSPTTYSPFGHNPETAKHRQQEVLRRMVEDGYISQQQADEAYNQPLVFRQDSTEIKAPHFVMYVRELLAQQYGEDVVNQGGLEVTTTLDLELQEESQAIVTTEVEKLARLRVSNGAALITNPQTGEILAMIGSKNYFDFANDGQVNVTLSERQPGSSIKPLTYAIYLERGKSPNTVIDDSPITYHIQGSEPYSPQNYDGKFHGKVTVREALGSSYNIPAVKALADIGIGTMIDKAQAMGIDTWEDRRRFGLSLTLGGGEVRMTDMAEVYSTFANYGYSVDLNPILEVKNYKGEVLYRNTCVLDNKGCPKEKNLNPLVAYQITDILKDNRARTPAFGARSVLHIPNQEVAVKTGTTNNLRDNWAIGYTSDRLVVTWVGNNNGQSMSYIASGVTGASPIWNSIIRLVLDDENPHKFATPDGMIKVKVCATTGTLPCQGCPNVREELFVPGTEPTKQCSPAWFQKKTEEQKDPNRDQILTGATTTQ